MALFEVEINKMYSLKGNDYTIPNPKALLLVSTGMDEHSSRYQRFAVDMNKLGYSVYVLDYFGQGENAKSVEEQEIWPVDAWNLELRALKKKVDELRTLKKPVYMMGHSMGSFFMQSYLEHYPNTVDKIIIMGSNGPGMPTAMALALAKMTTRRSNREKPAKLLQNMSLGAYKKAIKNRKTDKDWLSYDEENVKRYIADPYCGHVNTRGFYLEFFTGMQSLYTSANKKAISVNEHILIVSGQDDPVGNCSKGVMKLYRMYQKLGIKDVRITLYPGMRHEILNEKERNVVISDLDRFLSAPIVK